MPAKTSKPRGLGPMGRGVLVVGIGLALLLGLQLGGLPFRMRRHLLRLQGAVVGGMVGLLVGYASGRSHSGRPHQP